MFARKHKNANDKAACLLAKISIYLKEYVTKDVLKELDMAFVSIGQKYGFVSAGDEFRKELAEARAEAQAKAKADTATALRSKGLSEELIAEVQAEIDALQKKRREQAKAKHFYTNGSRRGAVFVYTKRPAASAEPRVNNITFVDTYSIAAAPAMISSGTPIERR